MPVIVLLADGLRPDTLRRALDDGMLPSLSRLRERGGLYEVTSAFPSVTGLAYSPFLLGRFPGPVGLPGLRWFDRSRRVCRFPGHSRSYVGHELFAANRDLDPAAHTLFELVPGSAAAMTMITRGLPPERRLTRLTFRSAVRGLATHFGGDIEDWLDFDRDTARQVLTCAHGDAPFLFAAFMGVDKVSHECGHASVVVQRALRIVDDTVGELLDRGRDRPDTRVWVASDHGHSAVTAHDDLHVAIVRAGHRALAHPWTWRPGADVAVMVSGNAMAHLYLELAHRSRPGWPRLRERWSDFVAWLLARPSVDVVLLPVSDSECLVQAPGRGSAMVRWSGAAFTYERTDGDPLVVGTDLLDVSAAEAHERTLQTAYPDSIVQVARLAGAARAGDVILSAAPAWDFRERYEPIAHVSTHGSLHRDHMIVPLLLDTAPARRPLRTADVMPSVLAALGRGVPAGLDGDSFL